MRLYANYPHLLTLRSQVVAGFEYILLSDGRRGDVASLNGAPITLTEGLTYDRSLLRWASDWRCGVPWLRYVLFWLRPRLDLELCQLNAQGLVCAAHTLVQCRVQRLVLGAMHADGGVQIARLTLKPNSGVRR